MIANTLNGILSTDPALRDLFQLYGASTLVTLFKLRFPAALPQMLTGLRVSAGLAVIGAIVGEFVASQKGLGYVILSAQGTFDTARVFAAVAMLAAMGLVLYGAVALAERKLMPWR